MMNLSLMTGLFYSTKTLLKIKNLTKGKFVQNLKNRSEHIYEHVLLPNGAFLSICWKKDYGFSAKVLPASWRCKPAFYFFPSIK